MVLNSLALKFIVSNVCTIYSGCTVLIVPEHCHSGCEIVPGAEDTVK